ncbi:MAG: T9SS type A sorting domain-containing protein, partial [Flavobacteriaceae bacterium]
SLHIKGIRGTGTIQIYSIIGNLIHLFEVQNFENFQIPVSLEDKQMYIIRIETKDFKKTLKIVNS